MKKINFHFMQVLMISAVVLGSLGSALAEQNGGACNGGSCRTRNNVVRYCPDTGGPTCDSGTACVCRCSGNGQNTSASNECIAVRNPNPRGNEQTYGIDLDAE